MTPPGDYAEYIERILRELNIPGMSGRTPFREADVLVSIGPDIYGREQKLAPGPAQAWSEMKAAAARDHIVLLVVSAFRSVAYQRQIIERKLAAGQTMNQILRVSAAPGFSEHHTGRAIDFATPNVQPLTEAFEHTAAFAWLNGHAEQFGFLMTYPRGNPLGVVFEPWHWAWCENAGKAAA